MSIHITDTHCHLDFNSFNEDREAVLEGAWEAGITRILNPGIDLKTSLKSREIAEVIPQVFSAVGIHPNSSYNWQEGSIKNLQKLAKHPKVVAIGEIGLDYYRDRVPREAQREIFRFQLDLAADLKLPVIIHNRDATEDLLPILFDWQAELDRNRSPLAERPGVLHSYSGRIEPALQAIAANFYIGITGPVTFKNALEFQSVVSKIPLEYVLIETDAPFLTPHPFRGRRNEPARVKLIAEKISDLHCKLFSDVAKITTRNAAKLFNW